MYETFVAALTLEMAAQRLCSEKVFIFSRLATGWRASTKICVGRSLIGLLAEVLSEAVACRGVAAQLSACQSRRPQRPLGPVVVRPGCKALGVLYTGWSAGPAKSAQAAFSSLSPCQPHETLACPKAKGGARCALLAPGLVQVPNAAWT